MKDTPDPIEQLRSTLLALIAWMAQSTNSPISIDEARKLVAMLPPERK